MSGDLTGLCLYITNPNFQKVWIFNVSCIWMVDIGILIVWHVLQVSISGDDEDDMPDDIRAAYEVFLQEQEEQQRNNRASWFPYSVTK